MLAHGITTMVLQKKVGKFSRSAMVDRLKQWTTVRHQYAQRVRLGHTKGEQTGIVNIISNSESNNNNSEGEYNENKYIARQWKEEYRSNRKGTGNFNSDDFNKGMALNTNMARYMRQHALRAPEFPPNIPGLSSRITVLYRGFREDFAKLFHRNGFATSKTYLAFALDKRRAEPYTYNQSRHMRGDEALPPDHRRALVKLIALTVPRGTPWLWFGGRVHKSQRPRRPSVLPASNLFLSTQVVLPPGTLMKAPRPLLSFFDTH